MPKVCFWPVKERFMNTLDIIVIGILAFVGIINFIAGFHRGCLNNIFTIAKIALLIFLTPIVGEWLKGIEALATMVNPIGETVEGILEGMGATVVSIIFMTIAFFAVLIVVSIVFAILKALLRVPFGRDRVPSGFLNFIDKVGGLLFSVAFYGAILFALLAVMKNVEALASFTEGSKLCEINPLNELFAGLFAPAETASLFSNLL